MGVTYSHEELLLILSDCENELIDKLKNCQIIRKGKDGVKAIENNSLFVLKSFDKIKTMHNV